MRGATGICIFTGIMDKHLYIEILRDTLLLLISDVHPERHCLMADNDPKHDSVAACQFFLWIVVFIGCIHQQSLDLNPTENLWHELKEFIKREVKPKCQQELVDGIKTFWSTVDIPKCCKYIESEHQPAFFKAIIFLKDSTHLCV